MVRCWDCGELVQCGELVYKMAGPTAEYWCPECAPRLDLEELHTRQLSMIGAEPDQAVAVIPRSHPALELMRAECPHCDGG